MEHLIESLYPPLASIFVRSMWYLFALLVFHFVHCDKLTVVIVQDVCFYVLFINVNNFYILHFYVVCTLLTCNICII